MNETDRPIILDARTAADHFPGIGRYVVNLARTFAQIAPDLNVSLLHDPSAAATRWTLPDLPRIECPVSPFSMRQQWAVPQKLRHVQAMLYHSPYYLMPYRPGVPSVFTCHDLIPLVCPGYPAMQRLIYRLAHTLALKTASVTIAVSQSTQADLFHCLRHDSRVVVIPEAAGSHFAPQSSQAVAAARLKHHLPDLYALYLGSNKPHKNLPRLVAAWGISNRKYQISNIKLVIAGHWDERFPQARQLAKESGLDDQVIFIGPVDEEDLAALYGGAVLFVFPSLYEGFGLPVLEAMACGTPVICGNTSSLPEVAGEAAILIDPLNVEALAEAIGRALTDQELRQDMRQKGLSQAMRFSWQRTARETLAVYERIA